MSEQTALQPQIKITWLIGTLAALAIFVVIGAYSARMTWTYSDYDQDRATQRYVTLKKVQADENALLYPAVDAQGQPHAEWVDQAKGVVRIPIDQAMADEVDTLKAQVPRACGEIPGTVPPPAAAPAMPGATNAAPVKPAVPGAPAAAKPAKPVKTTLLSPGTIILPGMINQPVFNLRRITPQPGGKTQNFDRFITYGGVPIPIHPSTSTAAATPNP